MRLSARTPLSLSRWAQAQARLSLGSSCRHAAGSLLHSKMYTAKSHAGGLQQGHDSSPLSQRCWPLPDTIYVVTPHSDAVQIHSQRSAELAPSSQTNKPVGFPFRQPPLLYSQLALQLGHRLTHCLRDMVQGTCGRSRIIDCVDCIY
jgi:hypothetical protein